MKTKAKKQEQKRDIEPNMVACPLCGQPTSKYYFSSVIDSRGGVVTPRCQNCGYFDDPE
jgi:uncharacterized Zn finger protein